LSTDRHRINPNLRGRESNPIAGYQIIVNRPPKMLPISGILASLCACHRPRRRVTLQTLVFPSPSSLCITLLLWPVTKRSPSRCTPFACRIARVGVEPTGKLADIVKPSPGRPRFILPTGKSWLCHTLACHPRRRATIVFPMCLPLKHSGRDRPVTLSGLPYSTLVYLSTKRMSASSRHSRRSCFFGRINQSLFYPAFTNRDYWLVLPVRG